MIVVMRVMMVMIMLIVVRYIWKGIVICIGRLGIIMGIGSVGTVVIGRGVSVVVVVVKSSSLLIGNVHAATHFLKMMTLNYKRIAY